MKMKMKMKMRMMTLYQLEISSRGRLGGDQGGSNLGLPESFRVSNSPAPAYSLLKQEQLQLAQPAFVTFQECLKASVFFNVCSLETYCANTMAS